MYHTTKLASQSLNPKGADSIWLIESWELPLPELPPLQSPTPNQAMVATGWSFRILPRRGSYPGQAHWLAGTMGYVSEVHNFLSFLPHRQFYMLPGLSRKPLATPQTSWLLWHKRCTVLTVSWVRKPWGSAELLRATELSRSQTRVKFSSSYTSRSFGSFIDSSPDSAGGNLCVPRGFIFILFLNLSLSGYFLVLLKDAKLIHSPEIMQNKVKSNYN